jgi:hypothetical protein
MSRAWFLQANPRQYEIDAALDVLDEIWWRVPQHTSEIHVGDVTALWRAGDNAAIVAVGRVVAEPQLRAPDAGEGRFLRVGGEDAAEATRALVRVRKTLPVDRETLRAMPQFREHQIVRAPMGTVFPISEEEWAVLAPLLSPPPDAVEVPDSELPPAFAWPQRAKGVLPMPGGYSGYLESLAKVCALVEEERPSPSDLAARLEDVLEVKATAARLRASFLRKVGIITVQGGVCRSSSWTEKWRRTGDDRIVVALLHSRCQLIGELLDAARQPRSQAELLAIANERYDMGWDTQTQIVNRRGWLQSAGMVGGGHDGRIQTTTAGLELLTRLPLHDPGSSPVAAEPERPARYAEPPTATERLSEVDSLVAAMEESAADGKNPERFEQAVRDAFAFLGFQAEWLGGSGKTDVLADALLGRDDSYRVAIDCKCSGSGTVGDQQVDWVTLGEHKVKHDAQFVSVVAPHPSGSRLFARAQTHNVTIISVDQFAGLCRQHAKTPLGLDDYRSLFDQGGGALDTQLVDERAEEANRIIGLAASACAAILEHSATFGRLSARDLFLLLANDPAAEATTEIELEQLLSTLASPLLRVLDGTSATGFRVTSDTAVAELRLEVLAQTLGSPLAHSLANPT